jgi:hypothetical protein
MTFTTDLAISYHLGLDLGQSADYTALAVVEEPVWVHPDWELPLAAPASGWLSPADLTPLQVQQARANAFYFGRPPQPRLAVRHLERFKLGTPYPAIVERVGRLLATPPLDRGTALVVDATGVGAPVVDLFRHAGLRPIAVTITGGHEVVADRAQAHVPKRELISTVQALLQSGRLKIAEGLPEAATLVRELLAYQVKVSAAGRDTYGAWREGQHDDLVLALALAGWYRQFFNAHLDAANAPAAGPAPDR